MRHKGYTLIELLIVVALFTFIFSIATPHIGMINRTREANELREFKRDLLYTRNKAIVDKKSYKFVLDYINNAYSITDLKGEPIKTYKFQYGIKLIRNPKLDDFTFSRYGIPSDAGSVSITDSKNKRYEISVTPATGKITLKDIR